MLHIRKENRVNFKGLTLASGKLRVEQMYVGQLYHKTLKYEYVRLQVLDHFTVQDHVCQ